MFKRFLKWLADDPSKFKIGGLLTILIILSIFVNGCSLYIKSKHGELFIEPEKKEVQNEMV